MVLLQPEHYYILKRYLQNIDFNFLFAQAVIDHCVRGRIYVDVADDPKTFYVVHNYGMSLLGGDHTNAEFNAAFKKYVFNTDKKRTQVEWLQVFPEQWNTVMNALFSDSLIRSGKRTNVSDTVSVELNTRVNFTFNKKLFDEAKNQNNVLDHRIQLLENTKDVYEEMTGSVIPKAFWNSSDDFKQRGVAFGLYYDGKLASTAFSSFRAPGQLELGIETVEEFKGRGFGEMVCTTLIDYCIEQNLEPIWACRLENVGSYRLAQKLGFIPSRELPYYKIGI